MQKVFYEDLGARIRELRKKGGLSQRELAEAIGRKSATFINLIESGKRRISLHGLIQISKALDLTLNYFLEHEYEAMDTNSLLSLALISDPDLTPENRKSVVDFVQFLRNKKD